METNHCMDRGNRRLHRMQDNPIEELGKSV